MSLPFSFEFVVSNMIIVKFAVALFNSLVLVHRNHSDEELWCCPLFLEDREEFVHFLDLRMTPRRDISLLLDRSLWTFDIASSIIIRKYC